MTRKGKWNRQLPMLGKLPGIIRKSCFQEVVSGWDVNDETIRTKKELLQML